MDSCRDRGPSAGAPWRFVARRSARASGATTRTRAFDADRLIGSIRCFAGVSAGNRTNRPGSKTWSADYAVGFVVRPFRGGAGSIMTAHESSADEGVRLAQRLREAREFANLSQQFVA